MECLPCILNFGFNVVMYLYRPLIFDMENSNEASFIFKKSLNEISY